jgi:hypothetical protein
MKRRGEGESAGAMELLEGAFWLVRRAGVGAWAAYYVGALPFVLGLLYFWADMSRSAYADRHCLGGALALAGLFVWMKCWQAVYAGQLWRRLAGQQEQAWTLRRVAAVVTSQAVTQPAGLYVLPLAGLLVLPAGWVYAFYQSATVLADGGEGGAWALTARASRQAALWPKQNHLMLGLMLPFSLLVWLNSLVAIALLPLLAKSLLGVEWAGTRLPLWWLNSTSLAMATALTYLAVDPLLKSAYVIRCFHGQSLRTGADLRAELKRFAGIRKAGGVVAGVLGVVLLVGSDAKADQLNSQLPIADCRLSIAETAGPEAPAAPKAGADRKLAGELDRAAEDVLSRPKYAWRMPQEKREHERGAVAQFLQDVVGYIEKAFRAIGDALRWLRDAVDRLLRSRRAGAADDASSGLLDSPRFWLILLLGVVVAGAAAGAWGLWRRRRGKPMEAKTEPLAAAPDLTDEDVGAERLPEDGWTSLARELLGKGELRLALRAMYLGCLANLADRELIALARHKSNRDYQGELSRRGSARPELTEPFGRNVRMFEDAWYGMHEVTGPMVEQFGSNAERIRGDARA